MKHMNTLCGEVAEYFYVKVGGVSSNHSEKVGRTRSKDVDLI